MFGIFDWSGCASRQSYWVIALIFLATNLGVITLSSNGMLEIWIGLLILAILQLPFFSVVIRRLHAIGHSGIWSILMLIPLINILAALWIGCAKTRALSFKTWPPKKRHRIAQFLLLLFIPLACSRAFWAPYWAPTGSMKPVIQAGDYFIATPYPQDQRPVRGDVIVFQSNEHPTTYVKRVIGFEGEKIQLIEGVIHINTTPVAREQIADFSEAYQPEGAPALLPRCKNKPLETGDVCLKNQFQETLPNGVQYNIVDISDSPLDNTQVFDVPSGHLFVLGDNRDNSNDSRIKKAAGGIGFVPLSAVKGKERAVLFSSYSSALFTFWMRWKRPLS